MDGTVASAGRRLLLPTLLVVLCLSVAGSVLSVERARAAAVVPLHPVSAPAPAVDGWSPSFVDSAGRPARWDPCTPIHYVVQEDWAPADGRADLAAALRKLSAASGLRFVDDGDTTEIPSTTRRSYQPDRYGRRWAPMLVGWVPPARTDLGLGHGVQGVTVAVAVPGHRAGSLVTAQVALDAEVVPTERVRDERFGEVVVKGDVLRPYRAHSGLRMEPVRHHHFGEVLAGRAVLVHVPACHGCEHLPRSDHPSGEVEVAFRRDGGTGVVG